MLRLWRQHRGHLPTYTGSVTSRSDSLDTDSYFEAEMDLWYRRMLHEAPPELLKVSDLSNQLMFFHDKAADGATSITLPEGVVRLVEVRLNSWMRPARIVADPTAAEILRQLHPYTRATATRPVVFVSGREIRLYPGCSSTDSLRSLKVVAFTEGFYEFDSSLLSQIHPS